MAEPLDLELEEPERRPVVDDPALMNHARQDVLAIISLAFITEVARLRAIGTTRARQLDAVAGVLDDAKTEDELRDSLAGAVKALAEERDDAIETLRKAGRFVATWSHGPDCPVTEHEECGPVSPSDGGAVAWKCWRGLPAEECKGALVESCDCGLAALQRLLEGGP